VSIWSSIATVQTLRCEEVAVLVPKGKQEAREAAYSASSEYSSKREFLGAKVIF